MEVVFNPSSMSMYPKFWYHYSGHVFKIYNINKNGLYWIEHEDGTRLRVPKRELSTLSGNKL